MPTKGMHWWRRAPPRLRPILMTTLTTIISMVPMIFSNDSGMSMMKDMAYVMVGGLIASTLLATFLMPAFYTADPAGEPGRHQKGPPQKAAARTCGGRKRPVLTAPNRDKTGAPWRGAPVLSFPLWTACLFPRGRAPGEIQCVMEACTMFYYERERYMPSAVGLQYVGASRSQRNRIS